MPFLDRILGRHLASHEEEGQKIGPLAGLPMLGLDALSSAAYGPEAALTLLLPLGALGLVYIGPIMAVLLALLGILYLSYRQTMEAYPSGGGSYTVAKENLGPRVGLLAAASLLLDYVLNVAVGIAAGAEALCSAFPRLLPHILLICLVILALVAFTNLRGIRESGTSFIVPTYLFIGTLGLTLIIGLVKTVLSHGHPHPVEPVPALPLATEGVSLWLLMKAFSSGCTAMTGVEAISNGISAFAKPAVKNAQKTLTLVVVILGGLLAGIAYLCRVYGIGPPSDTNSQSVLSQLVAAVAGRGVFYYVTLASILAVLSLSANTSFADFPRLCRLIAEDDYLPHAFASRGRRLVYSLGIGILTILSAALLVAFGGITDRLIPLFAIGAFGAFTLSQAGMTVHWRRNPGVTAAEQAKARSSRIINATGAVATAIALAVVLAAKFIAGAWITLLIIPGVFLLFERVKNHYVDVALKTDCPHPIDLRSQKPPIVVIPMKGWTTITHKALRFGLAFSPDVIALHISTDEADAQQLKDAWREYVMEPIRAAELPEPHLMVLLSPYRRLFNPMMDYIHQLKTAYPDRMIAVIIPELVESHWYQYVLHNQRATALKAALLLRGGPRVAVINVPWYLSDRG